MSETVMIDVLFERAKGGDQGAWKELVMRYMPLVRSVISRHRLADGDAGDVNQTVWLRLVEHLEDIHEPRALPGWIATTTRNECLRLLAARKRTRPVDPMTIRGSESIPGGDQILEEVLLLDERHQALREGMEQLSPKRRALLLLLMVDPPISYDEISRRMGIPVGSIGPTRSRCLEQLRGTPAFTRLLANGRELDARRRA